MSFAAFLLHFVFTLCKCCLLGFNERLLSFWCMLTCRSIVSFFHCISLLSHAWHCFCTHGGPCGRSPHTHAFFPVSWILHSLFSCMIIKSCFNSALPCIQTSHVFSRSSAGLGCLGPNLHFLARKCEFMEMKALPSLYKLHKYGIALAFMLALHNSGRQCLAGPRNCVMQFVGLHVTTDWNFALCSFSPQ